MLNGELQAGGMPSSCGRTLNEHMFAVVFGETGKSNKKNVMLSLTRVKKKCKSENYRSLKAWFAGDCGIKEALSGFNLISNVDK